MHPINNRNFGSEVGKMAIKFHNGNSVVTGYIVKQVGTKSFMVSVDGSRTFKVTLAQTLSAATTLTAGFGTIEVTPFGGATEHVLSILGSKLYTIEGKALPWVLGDAPVAGYAGVAVVAPPAPPEPPVANTSSVANTTTTPGGV